MVTGKCPSVKSFCPPNCIFFKLPFPVILKNLKRKNMFYLARPIYNTAEYVKTPDFTGNSSKNIQQKFETKKSKKVLDKSTQPVYNEPRRWGEQHQSRVREHSSAGRASALQAGGHRFEPCCSHQNMALWCSRLARQPVTLEVDGSSPFEVAKLNTHLRVLSRVKSAQHASVAQ